MQASVRRATANRDRAQAAELQARADLQRSRSLAQQGFVSPTQEETALLALRQRIDSGSFQIDFNEVASNILREAISGAQSARR